MAAEALMVKPQVLVLKQVLLLDLEEMVALVAVVVVEFQEVLVHLKEPQEKEA